MHSPRFFLRRRQLCALALAVAAASIGPTGLAFAQGAGGGARALERADQKFVEEAAQGGLAEVAMGQMAQQRGSHDQVKAYGQRMVQDHGKANEELKRIAGAKSVQLPATMGPKHQRHSEDLGKMSGAKFDRAYMKSMVSDHKNDISDFEKAAKSAKDADVRDFAARTLPTLQSHLQLAQTTYDAVK